jgi:hypothetical protein
MNPERAVSEGFLIRSGEGIEWTLTSTGSLLYRRMPAN